MKHLVSLAGCVLAVVLSTSALSTSARAAEVRAQDPATLVAALQRAGYRAQLQADDVGDPLIISSEGGNEFRVFFYNCTENTDCRTIQFYVGYSDTDATFESMNAWNRDNRFGRAYLGDDGLARLEMDVDLDDGGISHDLFVDNVEYWVSVMSNFVNHVR